MANFSFPPPPPPPPRAAPDASQFTEAPAGRGRGRGGSFRGRGTSARGRGGYSNNARGNFPNQFQAPPAFPQGQYGAFPGAQSFQPTAFNAQTTSSSAPQYPQGQKRKRGDFHGRGSNSQPIITRPKTAVAPAVPSFGAPLPTYIPRTNPITAAAAAAVQPTPAQPQPALKKRKPTNYLGLTPSGLDAYGSDSDSDADIDEEAAPASAGGALQIEYNGQTMSLSSKAEIKAWIEERKKRWPTKARVEAREAEAQKRMKEQAEARQKVIEARDREWARREVERIEAEAEEARRREKKGKESKEDRQRRKLEKHLAKAEKLRLKLEKAGGKEREIRGGKGKEKENEKGEAPASPITKQGDEVAMVLDVLSEVVGQEIGDNKMELELDEPDTSLDNTAAPTPPDPARTITKDDAEANPFQHSPERNENDPTNATFTTTPQPPNPSTTNSTTLEIDTIKTITSPSPTPTSPFKNTASAAKDQTTDIASDTTNTAKDTALDATDAAESSTSTSTSSSTSSSSSSDSDSDSESDSGPETLLSTSKPPPLRTPATGSNFISARPCAYFLARGTCNRGSACRFSHVVPERRQHRGDQSRGDMSRGDMGRGDNGRGDNGRGGKDRRESKAERKSLFQRMVEQEMAEENRVVVAAVGLLGGAGMLGEFESFGT